MNNEINNRNKMLLVNEEGKQSKKSWKLGKNCGVSFEGKDKVVEEKIEEMERKDNLEVTKAKEKFMDLIKVVNEDSHTQYKGHNEGG